MRSIRIEGIVTCAVLAGWAQALAAADAPTEPVRVCRALLGKIAGPGQVLSAVHIDALHEVRYATLSVPVRLPYCLVEGRIEPEPGSEIGFEVWLPAGAAWNGRFLAVGTGASFGDFHFPSLARGVNRSFATAATDNGHCQQRGSDNTWAYKRPVRVVVSATALIT
jgi:hypothetical protein